MKATAGKRKNGLFATRASAMISPPTAPQAKATAESASVHCRADTTNQNSAMPKGRIMTALLTAQRIIESEALNQPEQAGEAERHDEIHRRHHQIDFERG